MNGDGLPLVVLSHGGGGSLASHYDTPLALAHAGFVAAAISHTGDTYDDQSKVLQLWIRPELLPILVSYMLRDWPQHERLDGKRIGAFGFSNGRFTVLVGAGGIPDLRRIGPFCEAHSHQDLCRALKKARFDPSHLADDVPPSAWVADLRIKAVVMAAPAFAFTFPRNGLRNVRIPIQLWRAADDRHQPSPYYEEFLRQRLSQAPEYHVVPGAGHYDFLPPCSVALIAANPLLCADPSGFNRITFHEKFNRDIVRFFRRTLNAPMRSPLPDQSRSVPFRLEQSLSLLVATACIWETCLVYGVCDTTFIAMRPARVAPPNTTSPKVKSLIRSPRNEYLRTFY